MLLASTSGRHFPTKATLFARRTFIASCQRVCHKLSEFPCNVWEPSPSLLHYHQSLQVHHINVFIKLIAQVFMCVCTCVHVSYVFREKRTEVYDSMPGTHQEVHEHLRMWLRDESKDKRWVCGVCVCMCTYTHARTHIWSDGYLLRARIRGATFYICTHVHACMYWYLFDGMYLMACFCLTSHSILNILCVFLRKMDFDFNGWQEYTSHNCPRQVLK